MDCRTLRYPKASRAVVVPLLVIGLNLLLSHVEAQMIDEASKDLVEKCEKEILQKADKQDLETDAGKKECMEVCVCQNIGVLTASGEIVPTVPKALSFIDPEEFEVNRLKCNKAVQNAPYCEKWRDMKECMGIQEHMIKQK